MKTLLIIGILLVGLGGQAMSMGHPHNLFAARKQMRAKTTASVLKPNGKPAVYSCWQPGACLTKESFSKRLLTALSRIRPAQGY